MCRPIRPFPLYAFKGNRGKTLHTHYYYYYYYYYYIYKGVASCMRGREETRTQSVARTHVTQDRDCWRAFFFNTAVNPGVP
jgi:hypothetical protein